MNDPTADAYLDEVARRLAIPGCRLYGDSYRHRLDLKRVGAIYCPDERAWLMPDEKCAMLFGATKQPDGTWRLPSVRRRRR